MALASIVLIAVSMVLFARVLVYNTVLSNYDRQNVIVNVDSEFVGDINININSQNSHAKEDRDDLINDLIIAIIEFLLTVLTSIITTKYSLTGKII